MLTSIEIHNLALIEAKKASDKYIAEYGEPFYCGFAWVHIPNGKCKFINDMKKLKDSGYTKHWKKGYEIWNPCKNGTQSMDVKLAGAYAYAKVLTENGIECNAQSRAD